MDLDDNSSYPAGVGCTNGTDGPGTTIYAGRAATVTRAQYAWFQIRYGPNTYINLFHQQKIFNDPSTGRPIAVGALVSVGEALVMVGSLGGMSTGCHLHFEIDIGWNGIGGGGSNYDVDPTHYLAPAPRIDIVTRGADGYLYHKYWQETDQNLCAACGALQFTLPLGVARMTSDAGIVWWMGNIRMDTYAEGSDGDLWQYYWQAGVGGWAPIGPYPQGVIGSDTPAVAAPSTGERLDLFVIRGGQLYWKHYNPGTLPATCFTNCWDSYLTGNGPPQAPTSLVSHPAAFWFNQGSIPTLEVFAEGSNYVDYVIWNQNGSWSAWTPLGSYPNVPPAQYIAGPAAAAWPDGGNIDEYVSDNYGYEWSKKYGSGCWTTAWCPTGIDNGQPVAAVSDPGTQWWPWYYYRRIDVYFQGADFHLRGGYNITDGENSWAVDCGTWPGGTYAGSGFAPAVAVWRYNGY